MLKGRLGLEAAKIPYADRHGLLWLSRGNLTVEDGTLHFRTAGSPDMAAGDYAIPYQNISFILLGPGSTVSHDVFRLMARHGTGLVAVGEDGVRMYSAQPFGASDSRRARRQAELWNDARARLRVARRMYAWRLGEVLPEQDIMNMRGIEGRAHAEVIQPAGSQVRHRLARTPLRPAGPGIGRCPQPSHQSRRNGLGGCGNHCCGGHGNLAAARFIHEDAAVAFCLDIADLFRTETTIPVAFEAVRQHQANEAISLERHVRRLAGRRIKETKIIPKMIDRITELIDRDDRNSHP